MRDAPDEMEPVAGTIASIGAYTGRFPSPATKNCGVRFRLRSTVLWLFTFQEKLLLIAAIHFPGMRMPSMPRLLRHDNGARKLGSNTRISGLAIENVVPVVPSAHAVGPSVMFDQSGIGTAAPTQDNVTRVPGSPVDSTSSPIVLTPTVPR